MELGARSRARSRRDRQAQAEVVKFDVPRDKSRRDAQKLVEAELAKLLGQVGEGSYVDNSKTTLIAYLRDWHAKTVEPLKKPLTARIYLSLIEQHVAKAPIAAMPIQKVRASDLEQFYMSLKLAPSSVGVVHAIIHRALKTAVRDRLLVANPASAVEHRPRPTGDHSEGARQHCWNAAEARRVLAAAADAGPQALAFFTLALDTGARKSELLGLTWDRVDLDAGTVMIDRQLAPDFEPAFVPTKTGKPRTVVLNAGTVARLGRTASISANC